ncbi:MAG: 4-(cytidine 5'-diphospho)-2-C-methyl-D-erythritol kinase [Cetobacterium sp.]
MKEYNLKSNAKINIGLNIVGVLENGYHLLDMTMLPISLSDNLNIKITDEVGSLKIKTNKKDIPTDESNILYKIYKAFYKKINQKGLKIEVFLEKKIPHEAGLGGGSSNGATFLNFLNEHHKNILTFEELIDFGKKIGADIPFFILNMPCRVKGIGEKLEKIENNLKTSIVLIKPNFGVSTVEAYKQIKNIKNPKMANIDNILNGLKMNDLDLVQKEIQNNLEEALLQSNTELKEFKYKLSKVTNMKFFMSGSGSAYYAFLKKDIDEKVSNLKYSFKDCEIIICDFK